MKIDAMTHPDPWKRSFAARIMLLTIHELKFDKVVGGRLRQALDDGAISESLRQEMTKAKRSIRRAQSRAQKLFADLRNSTIAHGDPDALRQFRDIVALVGLEVTTIAGEFYAGPQKFIETLQS